jgi:hypothetical protein
VVVSVLCGVGLCVYFSNNVYRVKVPAESFENLFEAANIVDSYDVIGIDEGQFVCPPLHHVPSLITAFFACLM